MTTSVARSIPTAALALAATSALLATGLPGAAASPAGAPADSCVQVLGRATAWPGTATIGGRTVRLHSDAYDLYLSRQAPCRSAAVPAG